MPNCLWTLFITQAGEDMVVNYRFLLTRKSSAATQAGSVTTGQAVVATGFPCLTTGPRIRSESQIISLFGKEEERNVAGMFKRIRCF